MELAEEAQRERKAPEPLDPVLQGHYIIGHLPEIGGLRSTLAPASAASSSPREAWVPSIRLERTASRRMKSRSRR